MSVLIRGGRIITPGFDAIADIFVENETIALIGSSLDMKASTVIDAAGKYVLPGAVDPHTHMEAEFLDVQSADDFTSGTIAAAFGGTTTVVEFCEPATGQPTIEGLASWYAKLDRSPPVVDVGFHMIVDDIEEETIALLRGLRTQGITSFKVFMAFKGSLMVDDESLFVIMQIAAETNALLMVHAENGGAIEVLTQQAVDSGRREPRFHAVTRPPETEAEATNRAIQLASIAGCSLYFVHVSCAEALEVIERARAADAPVWAETCPQYLLFDDTVFDLSRDEAAKYVYTPPPRPAMHQDALWRALRMDVLSVISTDHAPFPFHAGKMGAADFTKITNGVPGIEERLMLIHHFGVRPGILSLERMVELLSTNPAKLFGLYPRKGVVAVGSDADLVVFDPEQSRKLSAAAQHSKCDYSIYEGTEVVGAPETVLVRGTPVIVGGELAVQPGYGQFLKRETYAPLSQLAVTSPDTQSKRVPPGEGIGSHSGRGRYHA